MSETTTATRPPEPDFEAITTEELLAYRDAENRFRASVAARAILGEPDPGAAIDWREIALPGRDLSDGGATHPTTPGPDGPAVSRLGLGCMSMTGSYGAADQREAAATPCLRSLVAPAAHRLPKPTPDRPRRCRVSCRGVSVSVRIRWNGLPDYPHIGAEFAALGLSRSRMIGSALCQLVPAVGFVDYAQKHLSQLLTQTG